MSVFFALGSFAQVVGAGVGVVLGSDERGDEHGVADAVVTASCPSGVAGAARLPVDGGKSGVGG